MDNEELLLAAVRDNPAEDQVRLAYADFLLDQGRAEQAAYVRAQVLLAQCAPGRMGHPGAVEMAQRKTDAENSLRDFSESSLIDATLNGLAPEFHRGFVRSITIEISESHQRLPAVLARHPTESVTLNDDGENVIVLHIRRGTSDKPAPLQQFFAPALSVIPSEGQWAVQFEFHDGTDPMQTRSQTWPSRKDLVSGISDWLSAELQTLNGGLPWGE